MTQIGQYLYPEGSIQSIDLEYQPNQSEGGTRCVRVWHNTGAAGFPNMASAPPYRDFRGIGGQTIRRNVGKLAVGGNLTVLLSLEEQEEGKDAEGAKARNAGRGKAAA